MTIYLLNPPVQSLVVLPIPSAAEAPLPPYPLQVPLALKFLYEISVDITL